jgi:hypothetical protein
MGAPTTLTAASPTLTAALHYATLLDWPVFPVHWITAEGGCSCGKPCTRPAKHPLTPGGLKDATTDTDRITEWWSRWPDANPAIRCDGFDVIVHRVGGRWVCSFCLAEGQVEPLARKGVDLP